MRPPQARPDTDLPDGAPDGARPDGHPTALRRMLNPLRSEGEAFRLLLYVAAVFAVIIAGVVIARTVF